MTTSTLLVRRTHLYLGLLLLPWIAMYALSTFVFNHGEHFRRTPPGAGWRTVWEKPFAAELPAPAAGPDALRAFALRLLADQGITAPFGVQRQGQGASLRLVINVQNFRHPQRLTFDPAAGTLRAEQQTSTWIDILSRLHRRTGYGQPGILSDVWAVIVDVFSVAILAWIVTGFVLWWKIPSTRRWGFAALGGGFATLAVLLVTL